MQCNAWPPIKCTHCHFWQTSQIRFQDVGHPPCSPHRGQLAASLPVLELPAGRLAGFHSVKINNDDIFLFPNNTILTPSIYFEQLDSSTMGSVDLFPCPLIAFRQYKNPTRTISQIPHSFSIKFHKKGGEDLTKI